jgi:hypothetical protein
MQNMHLKVEWREISFHWQDVRIIVVGAVVFLDGKHSMTRQAQLIRWLQRLVQKVEHDSSKRLGNHPLYNIDYFHM